MNLAEYRQHVEAIPYSKRLPSALYVFRADGASLGEKLDALLARVAAACGADARHNVFKLRLDELKVSFLSYPDFLDDPHPALRHGITVDLVTGKSRQTDYTDNINPPILHRKETFLPADHPRRAEFAALTKAEEAEGLYEHTTTIGFKLNWERLLTAKGLLLEGHQLVRQTNDAPVSTKHAALSTVQRHKTALARYDLSKPVKSLLEYGLLKPPATFFDYGCGQGNDVTGLTNLGLDAQGWDPVFHPETTKSPADIVNLGFVLNVIEDPAERLETLCDAYRLTRKLLIVSSMIRESTDETTTTRFRDGVLTSRSTFQKYFDQQELQQFIEDALDVTAVPVALGIFYVFRSPADAHDFLAARTRRRIEWNQISSRLGLGEPRRAHQRIDLYEQHKELLDAFWAILLELGRLPALEEFPRLDELRQHIGSPRKAERLFLARGGQEPWDKARAERRNGLLVYLALSSLRKPPRWGYLSPSLRLDIRNFFGNYRRALTQGRDLLFAAGDPGEIELACEDLKLGWQDEQALYIHRSLLERLPPVLQAYVGCATALFGDVQQADVIKLHKTSGKVTFLIYDNFENNPLPKLHQRIKANLRTRWVQVFDHSQLGQPLYFKERFLTPDHPNLAQMHTFSVKLRKLGLNEQLGFGPTRTEFHALLTRHGLNENLNKKRRSPEGVTKSR